MAKTEGILQTVPRALSCPSVVDTSKVNTWRRTSLGKPCQESVVLTVEIRFIFRQPTPPSWPLHSEDDHQHPPAGILQTEQRYGEWSPAGDR